MSSKKLSDLKVVQLKDKLKALQLRTTGTKAELIVRLMEATGEVQDTSIPLEDSTMESQDSDVQKQMELLRREKEVAERELEVARREIEMMRQWQQLHISQAAPPQPPMSPEVRNRPENHQKVNISAIADLLSYFAGVGDSYERWEKKVRLLKATYHLTEDSCKLLIGSRLKDRALEWFHSKPEYVEMPLEGFLGEMRGMFHRELSKMERRKRFEERWWKKGESFGEYFHEKIILANSVPIDEDEIVDHLIAGIPDTILRDQAYIQRFRTKASLLEAFEKVSWRGKTGSFPENKHHNEKQIKREDAGRGNALQGNSAARRCHSCGSKTHPSSSCPTKEKGVKCFACQGYGHFATKCPKNQKQESSKDSNAAHRLTVSKHCKEVTLNGHTATGLIDTGSDISLLSAKKYIEIGAPRLIRSEIVFNGIGSSNNRTLGELTANITIDDDVYPITVNVVSDRLMSHELLIGTDFLNKINMTLKEGKISISKPIIESDNNSSEIFKIDYLREVNKIDVSSVVDKNHRETIQHLVDNYEPVKTRDVDIEMNIILKDDKPTYQRARRLSPIEREEVNAQIDEWLRDGIVQPSLSEYASPVVLVKKKNGTKRLCVDYRQLNEKIVKDRYPLPLIEDQLDLLQNAKIFSTLDLKNGFFHVSINKNSRKYTAFIVPDGHFEFIRVPFGLCNSPAIFQRFVNAVFKDLLHKKIVMAYMDDLIIPSPDYESALENLKIVLNTAAQAGLVINWEKCSFLQSRVEFLGHIIENGHVQPSKRKTEAVMHFPTPKNAKQVQSFLGLAGYFRKFVCNYSIIARPLSNLLRKDVPFRFEEEESRALEELKTALSSQPVLRLYRVGVETELHTDASSAGYGCVLMQRDSEDGALHPVYYASGKTSAAEEKYTSYELEVLAIVRALKRFRVYLLGVPFKIVTDCRAFALTMRKKDLCVRVARWALLLEEFQYTIEHRPGRKMNHVDALSRYPLPSCLFIEECHDGILSRLKKAQHEDREIEKMINASEDKGIDGFSVKKGLLFKEIGDDVRLVVPKSMQSEIIKRAHQRGHFSVTKTELLVKKDYWFTNMRSKIEKIIRNCIDCILAERKQGKQEGFLHSIDKGEIPLDTYHIDHLGPVPSTKKNYKYIFVVVDAFSKFVWLYATKSTDVAEVLQRLEKQSSIFGNPKRIVSDRGSAFTSNAFEEYCKRENIEHTMIVTGVPRGNGQVERVNRVLIPILTKMSTPKPEEWHRHLDAAQKYLNSTPHRSIGMTPFNLLFGTHMRIPEDESIRNMIEEEWIALFQENRDELRRQAKEQISKIQSENRRSFNKRRKKAQCYRLNDLVAILRTQSRPGLKFGTKFLGPYEIIKVLRNDRYVVRKVGEHEGPLQTSTSADHMKLWHEEASDVSSDEETADT